MDSPLQHTEIFLDTVQGYFADGAHPGDHNLTFVDVGDVDAAQRGGAISGEQAGEYVSSVEASLRAWSVGGNTVGVLGNGKYGVVHEATVNSSAIEGRVTSLAEKVDPGGETLKTQTPQSLRATKNCLKRRWAMRSNTRSTSTPRVA